MKNIFNGLHVACRMINTMKYNSCKCNIHRELMYVERHVKCAALSSNDQETEHARIALWNPLSKYYLYKQ